MDILEQFVTMPLIVFCLVISVLVFFQKKILENIFPKLGENKWWRNVGLPAGPVGTGGILAAVLKPFPFPIILGDSWINRACLGIACGVLSAYVFRIVKSFFNKKLEAAGAPTVAPEEEILK